MKRTLMMLLMLVTLLVAPTACIGPLNTEMIARDATVVANGTRLTIENTEATALLVYKETQRVAIEVVKAKCGTTPECGEQARARIDGIREAWEPVWTAIDAAKLAHGHVVELVKLIEDGEADLDDLIAALDELADATEDISALLSTRREELSE